MNENKLTEAEIMKALECCKHHRGCGEHCPLYEYADCEDRFIVLLTDLINRKNAENEKLNFENLQMIASIKNLKAEAIKEFAERVKNMFVKGNVYCKEVVCERIDYIEKEMGCDV